MRESSMRVLASSSVKYTCIIIFFYKIIIIIEDVRCTIQLILSVKIKK
jgi:hypothetical protein